LINPNRRPNRFEPAMNRLLATVIATSSLRGWCDAVRMAKGQGSNQAGLPAPVAYAHDFGRESDDATTSGEGRG